MTEHEDSMFNQKGCIDTKASEAMLALPQQPLNRHQARQMLQALLKRIDNDLIDSEKQEFEQTMAEYGEKWFS